MGKITGFKEYTRQTVPYRDPILRLSDMNEIYTEHDVDHLQTQGARCMDCGVPFCQSGSGCPVDNLIPEWNDLVYHGRWREALDRLHKTNNFPEFTGRVCPAPCEGACVLGITNPPVTIKNIENAIVDRGFAEGWIQPQPPAKETGQKIAVVGSGPAGLAAAQQLRRAGHAVTVYERADRIGGLLMYGIPNMKLEKKVVERRVQQLKDEGVLFQTCTHIGNESDFPSGHLNDIVSQDHQLTFIEPQTLVDSYDAVLMATGATEPFDPTARAEGRSLEGIHFAMDFLTRNTKSLLDHDLQKKDYLSAKDQNVIVIGGGDTGADCIATSLRHNCTSVVNFELMDQPPAERAGDNPWPQWPRIFRVDYSHEEATAQVGEDPRVYHILTKAFIDDGQGHIKAVRTVEIDWSQPTEGGPPWTEMAGTEKDWPADLVLLSTGFVGPEIEVVSAFNLQTANPRGNWQTIDAPYGRFNTNVDKVFAAGDCRRGQSLVVWAINEGRGAAEAIDQFLTH